MKRGGIYRALVDDNNDPEGLGRVRLRVPAFGETSRWAHPVLKPRTLPALHVEVWVMFEAGDVQRPVYFYG